MTRGVYSVRDEASGLYMSLAVNDNDNVAIRGFDFALSSNDLMRFRPEDYSLWRLASYDDATGLITSDSPSCIKRGVKRGSSSKS